MDSEHAHSSSQTSRPRNCQQMVDILGSLSASLVFFILFIDAAESILYYRCTEYVAESGECCGFTVFNEQGL
jgi:hypothetical protein